MTLHYDEDTIEDLLGDSLVRAMMRADHVDPTELEAGLHSVARRVQLGISRRPAPKLALLAGPRAIALEGRPSLIAALAARACANACQTSVGW